MNIGLSIILSAVITALSYLIKEVVNNIILGLWLRTSGEIEIGDELTLKTDFGEKTGRVKSIYLRNVLIEMNGEELLVENKKVLDCDVIRKRS